MGCGFWNRVARRGMFNLPLLGQVRIWDDGFYAGTFSEYDFGAIRAVIRKTPGP